MDTLACCTAVQCKHQFSTYHAGDGDPTTADIDRRLPNRQACRTLQPEISNTNEHVISDTASANGAAWSRRKSKRLPATTHLLSDRHSLKLTTKLKVVVITRSQSA